MKAVRGNTREARRYRDLRDAILRDLGPGPHNVAVHAMAMRAAALAIRLESLEVELLADPASFDEVRHLRLADALRRALGSLGLVELRRDNRPQESSKKGRRAKAGAAGRDHLAEALAKGGGK